MLKKLGKPLRNKQEPPPAAIPGRELKVKPYTQKELQNLSCITALDFEQAISAANASVLPDRDPDALDFKHVPSDLFYRIVPYLSAAALRVLFTILADRLKRSPRVRHTVARVAKGARISKRQAQRGISELKRIELLRVAAIPPQKGSNEFVLNIDFRRGRLGENVKKELNLRDENVTPGVTNMSREKKHIRRDRSVTWEAEKVSTSEAPVYGGTVARKE